MASRRRTVFLAAVGAVVLGTAVAVPVVLSRGGRAGHLVATAPAVDFGRIPRGRVDHAVLRLRNEGPRVVTIGIVTANCTCFHVDQSYGRRLAPDEETEVRIQIDSSLVPAEPLRGKKLSIPSDDGRKPMLEVPLRGDILEVVRFDPGTLEIGRVDAAAAAAFEGLLRVRPGPGYRLRILRADASPGDLFRATRTPAEGGEDIAVRFVEGATGKGLVRGGVHVEFEVSGEDLPLRRITQPVGILGEWK